MLIVGHGTCASVEPATSKGRCLYSILERRWFVVEDRCVPSIILSFLGRTLFFAVHYEVLGIYFYYIFHYLACAVYYVFSIPSSQAVMSWALQHDLKLEKTRFVMSGEQVTVSADLIPLHQTDWYIDRRGDGKVRYHTYMYTLTLPLQCVPVNTSNVDKQTY